MLRTLLFEQPPSPALIVQHQPQMGGEQGQPQGVTVESVAAAKLACLRERATVTELTGVRFAPDGTFYLPHLDLGLLIGNAIAAAVYGVRGEYC